MTTAHLYLRVSTGKQADSGLGIEAQEADCRAHCEASGWKVGTVNADEGFSGSLPVDKRPGLLDALGMLGDGDVLLVAKRDRLGRDVIACVMAERIAEQAGARIVSVAGEGSSVDGPTGNLVRTILDAVAQWELAQASIRTRAAMRAKKARGEYTGGRVLLGYRLAADGCTLEDNPQEQAAIALMCLRRRQGLSFGRIAAELDASPEKYPTRTGKPWNRSTIARVCAESGV